MGEERKIGSSEDQIPGVDYCKHARALARRGELEPWSHVCRCAVCLRRFRILEADVFGKPLSRKEAAKLLVPMADNFAKREQVDEHQWYGFYASLDKFEDLEAAFACLVTARLTNAPPPSPGFEERLHRVLREMGVQ